MIQAWASWMESMAAQAALWIVAAAAADRLLPRRAWPQLRGALWLLVLAKLCLPPSLVSPFRSALPAVAAAGTAAAPPTGLFALWLTGALLTGIFALRRLRRHRRTLAAYARPAPARVEAALRRAARRLGLRRPPRVLLSLLAPGPFVCGLLRPRIVLPADWPERFDDDGLEHVMLHECAHVRRRDLWIQALYSLVRVVYWFHPLVHLAARRAHAVRELCCDATVAATLREETPAYRATLVRALRLLTRPAPAGAAFLGGVAARIRLLESEGWRRPGRRRLTVAAAVLPALLALPMARPVETVAPVAPEVAAARDLIERAVSGEPVGCLQVQFAARILAQSTSQP